MKLIYGMLMASLISCNPREGDSKSQDVKGLAVIELFTSEGCSSCPSAEKLLQEIAKEYGNNNVLVLAYHVDYWDRLGWKDKFSNASNTSRQRDYSKIFSLDNVYTPQAVVNGAKEFVGSDKVKMLSALADGNQMGREPMLTAKLVGTSKVLINYEAGAKKRDMNYLIGLVEKEAVTDVKAGENSGRQLKHINIVRQFEELTTNSGKIQFNLPDPEKDNFFVVLLAQNINSGAIESFGRTEIE